MRSSNENCELKVLLWNNYRLQYDFPVNGSCQLRIERFNIACPRICSMKSDQSSTNHSQPVNRNVLQSSSTAPTSVSSSSSFADFQRSESSLSTVPIFPIFSYILLGSYNFLYFPSFPIFSYLFIFSCFVVMFTCTCIKQEHN